MANAFIRNLPSSSSYLSRNNMSISNSAGGLNNVDDATLIKANQSADCKNMSFNGNYGMKKRFGTRYLFKAESGNAMYGENIYWYDKFVDPNTLSEFTITSSKSKVFINDIYVTPVSGVIEGVAFNGYYYFVDGQNLFRFGYDSGSETFKTYIIVNDPKFYIDKVQTVTSGQTTGDIEIVTDSAFQEVTYPLSENHIDPSTQEPYAYSSTDHYFCDPFGKVELVHGSGTGQVNSSNYLSYYVQVTSTVTKRYIKVNSFIVNYKAPQVNVNDEFTFNLDSIGHYTEHTIETYIDTITGLMKYTDVAKRKAYTFKINSFSTETGRIVFSGITSTPAGANRLYEDDFEAIFKVYDTITDPTEKQEYMLTSVTNILHSTSGKCYVPRDDTYNVGEVITNDAGLMWYQPCENEISYASLGENYLPTNPRNICVYGGRLWTTGDINQPSEVRGCSINQPYYFPAAVSLSMAPNGDEVQDLFEFDDALVVGRKNDIYAIYGKSASSSSDSLFSIKKMDATTGFIGRNCGSLINNLFVFLGYDGKLYKMSTPTTNIDYLMIRPISTDVDLFKGPLYLSREDMEYTSSVALNNEIYFAFGDKCIIYSYDNQAFTYYFGVPCYSLYTDGIDLYVGSLNGRLIYDKEEYSDLIWYEADNHFIPTKYWYCIVTNLPAEANPKELGLYEKVNNEYVKTEDTTVTSGKDYYEWSDRLTTIHKTAIDAVYKTKTFNDLPATYKYFEQIMFTFMRVESPKSSVYVDVTFDKVYSKHYRKFPVKIELTASTFGNSKWGENEFSYSPTKKTKWVRLDARSRQVTVIFSNDNIDESFSLIDANIIYTLRDIR